MFPVVAVTVLIVSYVATGLARRYALRYSLLDVPNARSSHSVPTPRGGGLAVAVAVSGALGYLLLTDVLPIRVAAVWATGGLVLAAVGWRDDHEDLPRLVRFAVQFAAATGAWYGLNGLTALNLGPAIWDGGPLVPCAIIAGIVWLVNLYNFMDGSDGLAAIQATFAAGVGAVLLLLAGDPRLAQGAAVLAMACIGFLVWNWPPAKIFLGDVGSYFIGYSLAVLAVASEARGKVPALVWVILLAPFLVDATATLIDRVRKGERWYAAHRNHVYQLLIQAGWSHARVALTYLALNLAVGLPAACWAQAVPAQAITATLTATCLISFAWFGLRAYAVNILGPS